MDEQITTPSPEKSSNSSLMVVVAVIALVVLAGIGVFAYQKSKTITPTTTPTPQENIQTNANVDAKTTYKNGSYTSEGEYLSPGGPEKVKVTVTLTNDAISDVEVVSEAKHPTSKVKQADFIANYKPFVLGKNIDEVQLTKVSGSSLTPKGFNDALQKIKVEAAS